MTSPTQRTLAHLRSLGYHAEVTEHWNQYAHVRQDLFGYIDVVALGDTILAVQATSTGVSSRVKKILELDQEKGVVRAWLRAGGKVEVWGWAKRRSKAKNADGSRTKRMETRLRRIEVRWDDDADPPCLTATDAERPPVAF